MGPAWLCKINGNLLLLIAKGFVCTRFQEHFANFHMAPHGSPVKSRIISNINCIHVSSSFQKEADGV